MENHTQSTNSHPLMCSSVSPDFPDLIPEKPKRGHTNSDQSNSFNLSTTLGDSIESQNSDMAYLEYNEELTGSRIFIICC